MDEPRSTKVLNLPTSLSTKNVATLLLQLHWVIKSKSIMKISSAFIVAFFGTASAFMPPKDARLSSQSPSVLFMTDVVDRSAKSASVPFMPKNKLLDGSYPGDAGFDPLFLADSEALLEDYRDAEIKHGRLAMLAALGWPASEVWDRAIAKAVSMPPVVDESLRAPSVLNGGLGKIPVEYWAASLFVASFIECANIQKRRTDDRWFPGNLNFDPLGLYPKSEAKQREMQLKEIKNGRLAMIAITAFAIQEAIVGTSVVDQTPFLFKPPFV